jgi:hypothetical protein
MEHTGIPIFTVRATGQGGFDMSDITIRGNEVEIDLRGMRSIVALRRRVTFRRSDIISVTPPTATDRRRFRRLVDERHVRLGGAKVPGHYMGGTFVNVSAPAGRRFEFWDVDDMDRTAVIRLRNGHYSTVYVTIDRIASAGDETGSESTVRVGRNGSGLDKAIAILLDQ